MICKQLAIDHVTEYVDDATATANLQGLEAIYGRAETKKMQQEAFERGQSLMTEVATKNFNLWSKYQWASGGLLNYEKCFWYLLQFKWDGWRARYVTKADMPDTLTVPRANTPSQHITIPRFEPSEAQRTLGVYIAPDGNCKTQMAVLLEKMQDWITRLSRASLRNGDRWMAYCSCIKPALVYPLTGTNCSVPNLAPIQRPLDSYILRSLGLNCHFPRALLHGPILLGGLGIPSLHTEQLSNKVEYMLYHLRQEDNVGLKLRCSLELLQMELGVGSWVFDLPFKTWSQLATTSLVKTAWRDLSSIGLSLESAPGIAWIPPLQRTRDVYLMEVASRLFAGIDLQHINMCRIYAGAATFVRMGVILSLGERGRKSGRWLKAPEVEG